MKYTQVKDSNDLTFSDLIDRDISTFSIDSLIMLGDIKYDSVKINAKCYLDESPQKCDPPPLYRIIKDRDFNYAMSIISYVESNTRNQKILEEMAEQKKVISFLLENEHLDYAWFSFPSVRILTEKGGLQGLFTRNGQEVINPKYESIDPLAFDDKYIIHLNDKFGLLDLNGKELIPPVLDDIYPHDFSPLILIVKNDKNGFCNKKGVIIFETRFDYVWPPDEKGFIIVSEKSKWGCIDTSGRFVLSLQYDTLGHFENGKAFVKQGSQSFFINREGRKAKNPAFD